MGAARKVRTGLVDIGGRNSGSPSALVWLWKSRSLSGSAIRLRCSKSLSPSGSSMNRRCSSGVSPEVTRSCICPDSLSRVMTP